MPGAAIGLLGPLVVATGDGEIAVAPRRQRTILAVLALHVGCPMGVGELVDVVWGDDPPATAFKTTQTYVYRLRRVLPGGWVVSTAGGYVLAMEPETVDAWCFERAVDDGRQALRLLRHASAAAFFEEALRLWRGPPVDLGEHSRGVAAAVRLGELRLAAEENLVDARLALGASADLVADLESAVHSDPFRERRWVQLMLALYRAGRRAEALRAYQRARTVLVESLGIEPGAQLREVERAILDGREL